MKVLINWFLILGFVSQHLCLGRNVQTKNTSYNVIDYGAIGNGISDDSQAFLKAWKDTCGAQGTVTLVIPPNKVFLLKSISFKGPCRGTNINIQLQGKIIVPPKNAWTGDVSDFILFSNVKSLTIVGSEGLIDGYGSTWWNCKSCPRPSVLHFNACNNLNVNSLHIINSPKIHIKISTTIGAILSNIKIEAPGNSPNTDGIDISASKNILIEDSTIGTGDDCIAIVKDSSYINVTGVACGPGHGISIGSLGKGKSRSNVEEIHVRNCTFIGTQNGARIKTWEGGSGYARKITFEQITLKAVYNPIIINQEYFASSITDEALIVSDVVFREIEGTSGNEKAINLDCTSLGCFNITLDHIDISYPGKQAYAFCKNAHGTATSTIPNVTCLLK
ncbi:hypothetical protein VNO77_09270 [Canavalia gladiata]|uniref:Polygalacturonase n=1 Tax=Canavalia gladiata TaxID=3824 RepID=A0AAN9QWH2_CANGL